MPRGSALGMVSMLSEKDELSWSRKQLMARLDVAMGGRVAEEIVFGEENVTSGKSIWNLNYRGCILYPFVQVLLVIWRLLLE